MIPNVLRHRTRYAGAVDPAISQAGTPASLAGLTLWVKSDTQVFSDAGVTPAVNAGPVMQWNDQSGNGYHISQPTLAFQPIFYTNVINGKPFLSFDGADDFMDSLPFAAALAQPTTMFIAFDMLGGNFVLDDVSGAARQTLGYAVVAGGQLSITANGGVSAAQYVETLPLGFSIMTLIFNVASSEIRKNAVSVATGNVGGNSLDSLRIAAGSFIPVAHGQINVAEVAIYDRLMSAGEISFIENYFNGQYAAY